LITGVDQLGLNSQALAAFGATCVDDRAATACFHANQKPVGTCAADFGRLVGAFHDEILSNYSEKPNIINASRKSCNFFVCPAFWSVAQLLIKYNGAALIITTLHSLACP
jgi:hypothetical protein